MVYMACWCLLQAADVRELRSLANMQSGPLGCTDPAQLTELHPAHPQQQQPQTVLLQPGDPGLHKLLHAPPPPFLERMMLSCAEPVSRTASLGSSASSALLGPSTPSSHRVSTDPSQGRHTAVPRYEPHLQPSQLRVVSQTGEGSHSSRGRGSTHPSRGNHGAELAHTNRQQRQPVQAQTRRGFAAAHVKALVGEVMMVDNSTGDDTHVVFCTICQKYRWRFYLDVRGELLQVAPLAVSSILLVRSQDSGLQLLCLLHMVYRLPFHITLVHPAGHLKATCLLTHRGAITPGTALLAHMNVTWALSMCSDHLALLQVTVTADTVPSLWVWSLQFRS